jgi:hypothetical protein
MKRRILLSVFAVALTGIIVFISCKKEADKTVTNADAINVAQNDATSDAAYNDIYTESESSLSTLESNKYPASMLKKSGSMSGGFTVTVTKNAGDSTIFPKEIKIVYTDYTTNSGIKKNGTLLITQSDRIRKAGAIRTITLENFIINDTIQVEGKKTITNLGLVSGKPSIKIQLENGKLTFNSGSSISRNFTHTITMDQGFDTKFNIWDDAYSISGSADGTTKAGLNYNTTITEPLKLEIGSFCIKQGKLEINVEGKKTVVLDYTRTTCLQKVKATVEGISQEFNTL